MRFLRKSTCVLPCMDVLIAALIWIDAITVPVHSFTPVRKATGSENVRFARTALAVAAAGGINGDPAFLNQANLMKKDAIDLAMRNEYSSGLQRIQYLFRMFEQANDELSRKQLIFIIEEAIGTFTGLAFSKPLLGPRAKIRVNSGLEAMQLQLSSLPAPNDQVPRQTFVEALRALATIIASESTAGQMSKASKMSTERAFRVLQRLLTGAGVRNSPSSGRQQTLCERDLNAVLNAMVNVGRMDIAAKILSLQERNTQASSLSPVTYSIMLKGYGKEGNIKEVEKLVKKAYQSGIIPDTIMLNSVLDAMVNCNEVGKAHAIFQQITNHTIGAAYNIRTFNTMLKGFAQTGSLDDAIRLTDEMTKLNLWDNITTNTLVSAAVSARAFDYAEKVLADKTAVVHIDSIQESESRRRRDHPNVEAYTSLLDGYAKAGHLDQALSTLKHMRNIGVPPNEYTYTCMITGLARRNRISQAFKLLDFMESNGAVATAVTYNALMSALSKSSNEADQGTTEAKTHPRSQEYGIDLLRRMVKRGVCPTVTTISILLESFAKCSNPRIDEANAIVERFERNGIIPIGDAKVNTAMIRVYGAAQDVKGALNVFRQIETPDIVAANAFLDAACRSGEQEVAIETFYHLFGNNATSSLTPDVITYSTLILSHLRLNNLPASRKAEKLYLEMRGRGLLPDIALVDRILSFITNGSRFVLQKRNIEFAFKVLKDAEALKWGQGELEQRKQIARAIMIDSMRGSWKNNEEYQGMKVATHAEDELFQRKGWNKVDSGFRLWGSNGSSISLGDDFVAKPVDEFLASKGWNDVDSGFRLL